MAANEKNAHPNRKSPLLPEYVRAYAATTSAAPAAISPKPDLVAELENPAGNPTRRITTSAIGPAVKPTAAHVVGSQHGNANVSTT
jgi:hypothetical protein